MAGRCRGAGTWRGSGAADTVKMSSPPKEKAETRAGHPPAGTAAGSRLSALSLATPGDGTGGPGRPRAGGAGAGSLPSPLLCAPGLRRARAASGGSRRCRVFEPWWVRALGDASPGGFPCSPLLGRDAAFRTQEVRPASPPEPRAPAALPALRQPLPMTGRRSLPCLSPRRALVAAKPSSGVCSVASPGSDPAGRQRCLPRHPALQRRRRPAERRLRLVVVGRGVERSRPHAACGAAPTECTLSLNRHC